MNKGHNGMLKLYKACTVHVWRMCGYRAKTDKDVVSKKVYFNTANIVWAWSIGLQNMIAYITLGTHIRQ